MTTHSSTDAFLEAAFEIGAKLCRDAIWDGKRCNWVGPLIESSVDAPIRVSALSADLYGGTAGIALFLAYLYRYTPEPFVKRTTEGAAAHVLSRVPMIPARHRQSFFCGMVGAAFALVHVGEVLDRPDFLERGLALVRDLEDVEPSDVDVIAGPAGAIPAILDIHRRHPLEFVPALVESMGRRLLETARDSEHGLSWDTEVRRLRNLTGFAHGAAGIATALLEAHRLLGRAEYLRAAEAAFDYENYWFDASHRNWPDFRTFGELQTQPSFMRAWCHGAPGIALARLRAFELTRNKKWLDDALRALPTGTEEGQAQIRAAHSNLSLCHGVFGNDALLLSAARILQRPDLLQTARDTGTLSLEHFTRRGVPYPCGVPNGAEVPGLMLGLAGIGYHYLKLHDPSKTPELLLISPS